MGVSDCLATPLALASSWKSKGAARRIVKDKGSGLIKPIETHRKELTSAKNWKDSDAAKQRSTGLCRDKAEARRNRLTPAIPNLINANGRRQALLVCSLPLVNPNGHRGL